MKSHQLKNSEWCIEGKLAEGGQAILCSVVRSDDRCRGVLKCLKESPHDNGLGRRWMLREPYIQRAVKGPGIPAVYDEGHIDGKPCFVAEFVKGITLAESIQRTPAGVPEKTLVKIFVAYRRGPVAVLA